MAAASRSQRVSQEPKRSSGQTLQFLCQAPSWVSKTLSEHCLRSASKTRLISLHALCSLHGPLFSLSSSHSLQESFPMWGAATLWWMAFLFLPSRISRTWLLACTRSCIQLPLPPRIWVSHSPAAFAIPLLIGSTLIFLREYLPHSVLWAGGWDPKRVPVQYLTLIMNLSPGSRLNVIEYPVSREW